MLHVLHRKESKNEKENAKRSFARCDRNSIQRDGTEHLQLAYFSLEPMQSVSAWLFLR